MSRPARERLATHRDNFDGLRLVGALLVLVSHQFALTGRPEPGFGPDSIGGLGLLVFFAMSGYLVAGSWQADPNALRFAARRLLRIWPGFAAVVVFSAATAMWIDADPPFDGIAAWSYLSNLWFSGFEWHFFPGPWPIMNGSLWTIPLELQCYVGLGLAGLLLGRWLRWGVLAGIVAAIVLFMQPGAPFLAFYGADFLVGASFFYFGLGHRGAISLIVVGTVAAVLGSSAIARVLIVPVASIWIGRQAWPLLSRAASFGDLSYGIYVWAWPLTKLGAVLLGATAPFPLLLGTTLISTGAMAFLSWHLVEAPALRLKPRKEAQ